MGYWGKILGTLIGFALLKLPGGILGLILGHLFDINYARDFSQRGGFARFFSSVDGIQKDAVFFHALFSALGHISKADGRVTQQEIQVASRIMDDMKLSGDVRNEAQNAFREGKAKDFPLTDMLVSFRESAHGRRDILQIYLELLIAAACADNQLSAPELQVLKKVASALGFSQSDLQFLITNYEASMRFRNAYRQQAHSQSTGQRQQRSTWSGSASGSSSDNRRSSAYSYTPTIDDAYNVIGISPRASDKEVKRAYKKQMSLHHPDKLASKGLPAQAIEAANQKTQDIQAAYELIKEKRGI